MRTSRIIWRIPALVLVTSLIAALPVISLAGVSQTSVGDTTTITNTKAPRLSRIALGTPRVSLLGGSGILDSYRYPVSCSPCPTLPFCISLGNTMGTCEYLCLGNGGDGVGSTEILLPSFCTPATDGGGGFLCSLRCVDDPSEP
jgi:hypothetical protein